MKSRKILEVFIRGLLVVVLCAWGSPGKALVNTLHGGATPNYFGSVGELGGSLAPNVLCQTCTDEGNQMYASHQCQVLRQQIIDRASQQRMTIHQAQGVPGAGVFTPTRTSPQPLVRPFQQ